ncbi:MAG: hypothetical protein KKB61_12370 [Alphaproteobacteria bacterium]|nr:hypothetical protein [Alphaproteobacteria bacterium]
MAMEEAGSRSQDEPTASQLFNVQKAAFFAVLQAELVNVDRQYLTSPDLINCGFPQMEDDAPRSERFAFDMAYIESELSLYRYPASLWKPAVRSHEQSIMQAFEKTHDDRVFPEHDEFARELSRLLNRERPASLPEVEAVGECGAGEDIYTLKSEPTPISLQINSRWATLVCIGQGITPYDPAKCRGWRAYRTPTKLPMVGLYTFQATWPDGRISRGELDVSDAELAKEISITPEGVVYE